VPFQKSGPTRDGDASGILSNLANPKIAIFFTSFFPQFAPGRPPSFNSLLLLGLVFCAIALAWLVAYSIVASWVGETLRRPRVRRATDGVTDLVLVGFGVRLAVERG
jgi:threonine/homoserine/homoserine lactone efflux protein